MIALEDSKYLIFVDNDGFDFMDIGEDISKDTNLKLIRTDVYKRSNNVCGKENTLFRTVENDMVLECYEFKGLEVERVFKK